jgi:hypothetical protein
MIPTTPPAVVTVGVPYEEVDAVMMMLVFLMFLVLVVLVVLLVVLFMVFVMLAVFPMFLGEGSGSSQGTTGQQSYPRQQNTPHCLFLGYR